MCRWFQLFWKCVICERDSLSGSRHHAGPPGIQFCRAPYRSSASTPTNPEHCYCTKPDKNTYFYQSEAQHLKNVKLTGFTNIFTSTSLKIPCINFVKFTMWDWISSRKITDFTITHITSCQCIMVCWFQTCSALCMYMFRFSHFWIGWVFLSF